MNQASRYKQVKAVESIYNHKVKIHEANQEQADLLEYILSFNNKTKPISDEDKN